MARSSGCNGMRVLGACMVLFLLVSAVVSDKASEAEKRSEFYLRGNMDVAMKESYQGTSLQHVDVMQHPALVSNKKPESKPERRELADDYTPCANNKDDPSVCP